MVEYRGQNRLLLIGLGVLWIEPMSAFAADWTVRTTLSETVSATDNVNFDIEDRTPAIGSNTNIGLNAIARSHLYDFYLNGSLGYQAYFGESQDIPDSQYIPSLNASYIRKARDLTFTVGGAYVYTPAEDQRGITIIPGDADGGGGEPDDDSVVIDTGDGSAARQVVSVNTKVDYEVNALNNLSWTTKAARIDYFGDDADDETPSTNASTALMWSHKRTRRVDLNVSTGVDWYKYENDENQIEYVYYLNGGFTNRVTRRLTVNGSLGVRLLDSYQDEETGLLPPDDYKSEHKTDFGGSGSLAFRYLLKTGSIAAAINYGLTPDDDGELANSLSATFNLSYPINDRSSFGVGAGYRLSESEVDGVLSDMSFSISPRYNYILARDWNLGLGYTFTMQDNDDGNTIENIVSLSISRTYTILP